MTERQTMIHRQSGSVSFTQCHCCKEPRWIARGMCHSAAACCCGVITCSINCIYLSRFKRLWHIFFVYVWNWSFCLYMSFSCLFSGSSLPVHNGQIYLRFLDYEMANSNECKRNFVAVYDGGRWLRLFKNLPFVLFNLKDARSELCLFCQTEL